MITKRIRMDNIVKISGNKPIKDYYKSVVDRCQPDIYNNFGCIKMSFTRDLIRDVDYLCRQFWHLGLVIKSLEKADNIKTGRGDIIYDAWVLTVEKIPDLKFPDDEYYEDWVRKLWEKVNGSA
jgi:hypothetical protein